MNALIAQLDKKDQNFLQPGHSILVVDFMGLLRKIPIEKMGLRNYGNLMTAALKMILSASSEKRTNKYGYP